MNRDYGTAMNEHLAHVIADLNRALILARSKADPEDYESIQKAIGLMIGSVEMELLWPIYRAYPDLDPIDAPIPPA